MSENTTIQGNCLEVLKKIPSESVDLIITDPPYNISQKNYNRDRTKAFSPVIRRTSKIKYDFGGWDNKDREEFLKFTGEWLKECCRILKEGGTIISFFNKEDISFLGWEAKKYDIRTRVIFTWHKSNPVPQFRKVNYLSATEFAWIGSKGKKAWTFNFKQQKQMHNYMITANGSSYKETKHPTEKPLVLIKHWIEIHSKEGDTVLDCFAGSGTVGKACLETNRHFILIEQEKEYIEMIQKRLEKYSTPYSSNIQSEGNARDGTDKLDLSAKKHISNETEREAKGVSEVSSQPIQLNSETVSIPPNPKWIGYP